MYRAPDPALNRSIFVTAFNSKVFGLNRENGEIVWTHDLGGFTVTAVDLQIVDQVVLAVTLQKLAFLQYESGRLLRVVELKSRGSGRPTLLLDGGHIYVAVPGEVLCYTPAGERVWLQGFKGQGHGAVAMAFPGNIRQADD